MNPPFFSIIIPTYNRAELVARTIRSILEQQFQDFEIIVVDDGGNDNTKQVIEGFSDNRIKYFWKENAERGAARNFGLGKAVGSWINFFDSDDIAFPDHLKTAYDYINLHPDTQVFHTSYDHVDIKTGEKFRESVYTGNLNKRIRRNNCLSCNNVFIKKTVAEKFGFSENRGLAGSEDWLLWLLLSREYSIEGLPQITSSVIHHTGRSMATASGNDTETRGICFIETCKKYPSLKPLLPNVISEIYSLSGLYYAMGKKRKAALRCAITSIKARPLRIFSRRFFAIIRHLI